MIKYLIIIMLITLLWTCSENNNPSQSHNSPPDVSDIILNPSQPKSGQVVTLTAVATDSDGDELSYTWSVSAGQLSGNGTGNPIDWTAPETSGECSIRCDVSDGKENVIIVIYLDIE